MRNIHALDIEEIGPQCDLVAFARVLPPAYTTENVTTGMVGIILCKGLGVPLQVDARRELQENYTHRNVTELQGQAKQMVLQAGRSLLGQHCVGCVYNY